MLDVIYLFGKDGGPVKAFNQQGEIAILLTTFFHFYNALDISNPKKNRV